MPKKYDMGILYVQIILIVLALVSFFAYSKISQIAPPIANIFLIVGFASVGMTFWMCFLAYKKTPIKQPLSKQKPNNLLITPQAKKLHEALKERGIYNKLEPFDGHKHVDISIPWAKLNLEVDGKYHLTDPEHLFRDLQRDACSHNDGIDTIRIPNFFVDNHLDELAYSIAEVAKKRQNRT